MADRNVIGLAMDLDVSTLREGLNEAKERIQDAEAQFKLATSSMEDWTKSTDGLRARVDLLSTTLTEHKRALAGMEAELKRVNEENEKATNEANSLKTQIEELNGVYEKSVKETGKNSDASLELKKKLDALNKSYDKAVQTQTNTAHQARELTQSIANQTIKVNKTQISLNNYENTLKEAKEGNIDLENSVIRNGKALEKQSKAADESTKSLDGFKNIAGGIGKAIAGIGAALVGAAAGFLALAESTRETRKQLGALETSFTSAGHSADEGRKTFESLYGVLGESDQALEASQHIAQLSQNEEDMMKMTEALTGVYATFGKSLPIEGLAEAANESAKVGKTVGPLADALNWTTASSEDWSKALGGNKEALAAFEKAIAEGLPAEDAFTEALKACNSEQERATLITDTLNSLYGKTADNYKEINKDVIEAQEAQARLTNTMADFGAIAEPIMTTLKNLLSDNLELLLPFAKTFGEGLSGILKGTDGASEQLAGSINGIVELLISKVGDILPKLSDIIVELFPQITNTLLSAVPSLLETAITIVNQIILALAEIVPQMSTKMSELIPQLITTIVDSLPMILDSLLILIQGIVDALPTIINNLVAALPALIDSIMDFLIQSIPILIDAAVQLFHALIEALPVVIENLVEVLPQIIDTIIEALIIGLPVILDGAIKLFTAIIDAIPKIIPQLVKMLPRIIKTIVGHLIDNLPMILEAAITLFLEIVKAIPEIIPDLVAAIPDIIKSIVEALIDGIPDIFNVGVDLVKGLWEGIKATGDWLWKKLTGWVDDILGWLCDLFGINSPSKVMEELVGENLGLGVGKGILGSTKDVMKDIDKFNKSIVSGLELSKNVDLGAATAVAPVGNNITFVQNITSTKELTIKQLSRYTNNLLDLDKVRGYV